MGTLRFFEEVVSFKIRRTFGFADYKFTSGHNFGAKSANSEKISYICRLKQSVFARQTTKRRIPSSDRVRENGTKNFIYVGKQTQNRHHAG